MPAAAPGLYWHRQEALMVGPLSVLDHYGTADLTERIDRALKQAGLDDGSLTWPDLAPLDQFHVRGLAAT